MKGDQMGTCIAYPTQRELPLSNWTWFSRLDDREVPGLVRLRWQCGVGVHQGRAVCEHQPVLAYRRDRLVVLALLCSDARALADPGGSGGDGPDGLCRVPARDPAPAPIHRGADLYRHSSLERDGARWAFRSHGAAGCTGP